MPAGMLALPPKVLEELFLFAAGSSLDALLLTDSVGHLLFATKNTQNILGYESEEIIGQSIEKVTGWKGKTSWAGFRGLVTQEGAVTNFEAVLSDKEGSPRVVSLDAKTITIEKQPHIAILIRDETSLKANLSVIAENERRFRDFSEIASDFFWELDEHLKFTYISQDFAKLTENSPDFALGQSWDHIFGNGSTDSPSDSAFSKLKNKESFNGKIESYSTSTGGLFYFSFNGKARFDDSGIFLGYRGTANDVTQSVKAEHELLEKTAMLEEAEKLGKTGYWHLDMNSRQFIWSDEIYRVADRPKEPPITLEEALSLYVPEDREKSIAAADRAIKEGGGYKIDLRFRRASGEIRYVRIIGQSRMGDDGRAQALFGVLQDITDSKKIEGDLARSRDELEERVKARTAELRKQVKETEEIGKALRESEERYSDFADVAADWVWEMNADLRFTYFSQRFKDILGIDPSVFIGKSRNDNRNSPDDEENWRKHNEDLKNRLPFKDFQYPFKHPDGTIRYVRINGKPIYDERGDFIGYRGTGSDVTKLVESEQALKASQTRFKTIAEFATDWFWETDEKHRFTFVSDRFFQLSGADPDDLIGKTRLQFTKGRHFLSDEGAFWESHSDDLRHHRPFKISYPLRHKDGNELYITVTGHPLFSEEGNFTGYLGAGTDNTQQKLSETKIIQAMKEAEKANQAKSEFLSRMSHELRTPMNSILGFSQLLHSGNEGEEETEQDKFVGHILKAGLHLLELIDEVLDLAKIEAGKVVLSIENVLAGQVCESCVDLIQPMADKNGIALINEVSENSGALAVRADFTRLKQVLVNLTSNAIKYNRPNGKVTITCHKIEDSKVRFQINDTGIGISAEDMDGLFAPFNRLRAETTVVQGTGIGLTITKKLLELMGGTIGVESTLGEGSRFWIDLPAANGEEAIAAEKASSRSFGGKGKGTAKRKAERQVLYIEDNPANLALMESIIAHLGNAEMFSAHTGALGVDLARARQPDLILVDINLPGIDGFEVLDRIRTHANTRHIPVIAVSAEVISKDRERGLAAGFTEFLIKPIDVARAHNAIEAAFATAKKQP